ncbi:hypothetical protein F4778DRAFT_781517 [Xylariomycetidae sp. FL2044]|nr:hypothetical protein F4778DRAFT_781517 [Xylariomycetidae sp. FL2044]
MPKSKNSDTRREQNRIASRAYREKRKQKLALLDEILKSDSQTADSMSSVSDEAEVYHTPYSAPGNRHSSRSPVPPVLSTLPTTTAWATSTPPVSLEASSYGQNMYGGDWLNDFARTNETFTADNHYMHTYVPGDTSIEPSSQYPPSIPSIQPFPENPPIAPDPSLSNSRLATYHMRPVSDGGINDSSHHSASSDGDLSGMENDMVIALESFSKLNYAQQQQIIAMAGAVGEKHRNSSKSDRQENGKG